MQHYKDIMCNLVDTIVTKHLFPSSIISDLPNSSLLQHLKPGTKNEWIK